MKVKVKLLGRVRLCDPMDCSLSGSSVHGIFQTRVLETPLGLPFPSPGDLLNPGIEPGSPALQADALLSEPPGKPINSVQSLSCVQLFAAPWTAARQAFLSITNSRSLLKLMSIELVMPSNHPILCHPLLLPPSIFPSIRVFSKKVFSQSLDV